MLTDVGHYKGQVFAWNVANEAVDDDGSLRDTIWLPGIGPEYIAIAFDAAHEAEPDALLFFNDYGGEGLGLKSDAIRTLIDGLVESGVPIRGAGLQMHESLGYSPTPADIAANMARLSELGLEPVASESSWSLSGSQRGLRIGRRSECLQPSRTVRWTVSGPGPIRLPVRLCSEHCRSVLELPEPRPSGLAGSSMIGRYVLQYRE